MIDSLQGLLGLGEEAMQGAGAALQRALSMAQDEDTQAAALKISKAAVAIEMKLDRMEQKRGEESAANGETQQGAVDAAAARRKDMQSLMAANAAKLAAKKAGGALLGSMAGDRGSAGMKDHDGPTKGELLTMAWLHSAPEM